MVKKITCLVCLFYGCIHLDAQVLNGKIYKGIGDEPLYGVSVRVKGFTQTRSDEFGEFTLRLPGKKKGALLNLGLIKEGFTIINREILKPRIPANDSDVIEIYMCPIPERPRQALEYYKIRLDQKIERNYKKEAKMLADRLEFEKISELTLKKNQAERMIDSLAARLARFDPLHASEEHTRAMQLFEEGKIQEAFAVIDPEKILSRIQTRNEKIDELDKANQQDIQSLIKAGDMAVSELDFARANTYYQAAVDADTSSFDNLTIFIDFLSHQNESLTLQPYAHIYVRQAQEDYQRGIAWIKLGDAYFLQKQPQKALAPYQKAIGILKKLLKEGRNEYQVYLGIAYSNLANTYDMLLDFEKAIANFDSATSIVENNERESRVKKQEQLAVIGGNRGLTFHKMKRYQDAQLELEETVKIMEQLLRIDQDEYIDYYPATLNNLGNTYFDLGSMEKAQACFELANENYVKLLKANPAKYKPEHARNLADLGSIFEEKKDNEKALNFYKESLLIREELARKNPDRYLVELGFILGNIAIIHENLFEYEEASRVYERAVDIKRQLVRKDAQLYEASLAKSLHNSAFIHLLLGNFAKAKRIQLEAYDINDKLYESKPMIYADVFGKNCYNLGQLEAYDLNFQKARSYFQMADSAYSLVPQTPEIQKLRKNTQISLESTRSPDAVFQNLFEKAYTFMKIPEPDSANVYFKQAIVELDHVPVQTINQSQKLRAIFSYRRVLSENTNPQESYAYRQKLIQLLKRMEKDEPEDETIQGSLLRAYVNAADDCLYLQRFKEAEKFAQMGLKMKPANPVALNNLAAALLFQGKFKKASVIYREWKDKPYEGDNYEKMAEAFLENLQELEKAGITHRDVKKIAKLLGEI